MLLQIDVYVMNKLNSNVVQGTSVGKTWLFPRKLWAATYALCSSLFGGDMQTNACIKRKLLTNSEVAPKKCSFVVNIWIHWEDSRVCASDLQGVKIDPPCSDITSTPPHSRPIQAVYDFCFILQPWCCRPFVLPESATRSFSRAVVTQRKVTLKSGKHNQGNVQPWGQTWSKNR